MKDLIQEINSKIPLGWVSLTWFSLVTVNEVLQFISIVLGIAYLIRKWYKEEKK